MGDFFELYSAGNDTINLTWSEAPNSGIGLSDGKGYVGLEFAGAGGGGRCKNTAKAILDIFFKRFPDVSAEYSIDGLLPIDQSPSIRCDYYQNLLKIGKKDDNIVVKAVASDNSDNHKSGYELEINIDPISLTKDQLISLLHISNAIKIDAETGGKQLFI